MAGRNLSLCGLYLNFASVRNCVDGVKSFGVRTSDISMALPDGSIMSAMPIPSDPQRVEASGRNRSGAAASAYPDYSARVAPLASALTKALLTLGVPVYDSERLESKIRNGGILVSVRCSDSVIEKVTQVLIQTGAQDVSVARDTKVELERCSVTRKEPYASPSVNEWQQRSAHA
ncbi:MAG: hypothetical protein WBD87_03380 [Candidatus Acidiferrales bacterium]